MKTFLLIVSLAVGAASLSAQQPPAPLGRGRAAAPPPPAAAAPFPAGAKIAFVNIQAIVSNSVEGKADSAKVDALVKKKQSEAPANQKTPQDAQRFQQQAQQEVQQLQAQLQEDFQKKLFPILQQLAQEKHLSMLLSAQDAGLVWAEPGLDLTAEAIKRFDAAIAGKK
jgi:Skp family chaperone for outer membrane proteins